MEIEDSRYSATPNLPYADEFTLRTSTLLLSMVFFRVSRKISGTGTDLPTVSNFPISRHPVFPATTLANEDVWIACNHYSIPACG